MYQYYLNLNLNTHLTDKFNLQPWSNKNFAANSSIFLIDLINNVNPWKAKNGKIYLKQIIYYTSASNALISANPFLTRVWAMERCFAVNANCSGSWPWSDKELQNSGSWNFIRTVKDFNVFKLFNFQLHKYFE